jgi:hypothetical protein
MLMVPKELTHLLTTVAPRFTKRTVTAALRVRGLAPMQSFPPDHRVLKRAAWSSLEGSRLLLPLLVPTLAPTGPCVMGWDETIERRRGAKIQANGMDRDPGRSSRLAALGARPAGGGGDA